jgi:glycerol-3-phosphate dehydrogenase (NAD(P)+)
MKHIYFLGAGAWGTAMAMHASKNKKGLPVTLWSRSPELAKSIRATGFNQQYLQDIQLPAELLISSDWNKLFENSVEEDLLFIATPVSGLKETVDQLLKLQQIPKNWVWLCKGLEPKTSLMPHQVIARELHHRATQESVACPGSGCVRQRASRRYGKSSCP